jgi:hypothetical protein
MTFEAELILNELKTPETNLTICFDLHVFRIQENAGAKNKGKDDR